MPVERDFISYHESIGTELEAVKDRIRHLIGDAHWPTEGQHKEVVLRKVLRNHLPDALRVGTGFVCGQNDTSHQTDILITSRGKPTLFQDGELVIVTPDAVEAIIEVKTRLQNPRDALTKLADDIAMIRMEGNPACKAGLFVYESECQDRAILTRLQEVAQKDERRAVDWVAAGQNVFVHFWENGSDVGSRVSGPVWHSYNLDRHLGHAYFVSNVVCYTGPDATPSSKYAWFPIEDGKERRRSSYVSLEDGTARSFDRGS